MRPSISGLDSERIYTDRIDRIFDSEHTHLLARHLEGHLHLHLQQALKAYFSTFVDH